MFGLFNNKNKLKEVEEYSKEQVRSFKQNPYSTTYEQMFSNALYNSMRHANLLFEKTDDSIRIRHIELAAEIVYDGFHEVDSNFKREKIKDQFNVISKTEFFSQSDEDRANKAIGYIKDLYSYKYGLESVRNIYYTPRRFVNSQNEIEVSVRVVTDKDAYDYCVHFSNFYQITKFTNNRLRPI